jgi:hypothetical protein
VKKKRKHFKLEDFTYDKGTDRYTCPNGEKLTLCARHAKIKTKIYRRYGVAEGVCDACRYRKRCLKTPTARRKYLDRFTLRGKLKVNVQWKLYCIIHNIEKIVNYGASFA